MKRFTETQKWEDQWFRRLPLEMKALWCWLLDKCDNAGVIDPDIELASFQIGYQYPMDTLSRFEERVVKLACGKYFIPKFIAFQYGKLSADCRAHGPVFQSLAKHGINADNLHFIGYPMGMDTLQDKDKEKVQIKDKEKAKEKESEKSKSRGTIDELKAFAVELGLPESDGESMFWHWDGNGWKNGPNPVKNWKSGIQKWKSQGWLPSQKSQPSLFPTSKGTAEDRQNPAVKKEPGIQIPNLMEK